MPVKNKTFIANKHEAAQKKPALLTLDLTLASERDFARAEREGVPSTEVVGGFLAASPMFARLSSPLHGANSNDSNEGNNNNTNCSTDSNRNNNSNRAYTIRNATP